MSFNVGELGGQDFAGVGVFGEGGLVGVGGVGEGGVAGGCISACGTAFRRGYAVASFVGAPHDQQADSDDGDGPGVTGSRERIHVRRAFGW